MNSRITSGKEKLLNTKKAPTRKQPQRPHGTREHRGLELVQMQNVVGDDKKKI